MDRILVLNADYQPMSITPFERGVGLVFLGKAEVMEHDKWRPIKTANRSYRRPTVIRLIRYVTIPFKKVPLSRFNIYRRDGHRCIYCGERMNLTLDHVLPRSKGGKNSWKNLVTCCAGCNIMKGDRTPEEVGLVMSHSPYVPKLINFIRNYKGLSHENWKNWLF